MRYLLLPLLLTFVLTICHAQTTPRIVVLTDIEADPDDAQSMIRFLLYANHFEVEGLIATTSIHQKARVSPESIHRILSAYEKVRPNLLEHEKGFLPAGELAAKVRAGLPVYGMNGVGEGHDSEGSEHIIEVLKKEDDRPVWFTVWGGPNTLAQALWKIKETMPPRQAQRLYDKVRIYTISDQDDSGPWIRNTFPGIFYIVTPGYNYSYATWRGMMGDFPGSNSEVVSDEWLAEHIQQDHGPLGAAYPDVAYGMEGDTPSFLGLIPNGLNVSEHPDLGGWGGRYELYKPEFRDSNNGRFRRENWPKDQPETRAIWTNAVDSVFIAGEGYGSNEATIWRWREAFQHDFAARMDWTIMSYEEANHPPEVKFNHPEHITMKSGETFRFSALGTEDSDGDSMSYLWFMYPEAGTYPERLSFRPYAANMYEVPFTAPDVTKKETLHFILQVTDKGRPSLTRYKRLIITVLPD